MERLWGSDMLGSTNVEGEKKSTPIQTQGRHNEETRMKRLINTLNKEEFCKAHACDSR